MVDHVNDALRLVGLGRMTKKPIANPGSGEKKPARKAPQRNAPIENAGRPTSELTPMEQAKRDLAQRKQAQRLNADAARGTPEEQDRLTRMYGSTTPLNRNLDRDNAKLESWYRPKLRR